MGHSWMGHFGWHDVVDTVGGELFLIGALVR